MNFQKLHFRINGCSSLLVTPLKKKTGCTSSPNVKAVIDNGWMDGAQMTIFIQICVYIIVLTVWNSFFLISNIQFWVVIKRTVIISDIIVTSLNIIFKLQLHFTYLKCNSRNMKLHSYYLQFQFDISTILLRLVIIEFEITRIPFIISVMQEQL